MKTYLIAILLVLAAEETGISQGQYSTNRKSYERIIRGYFSGWEKKDWNDVAAYLAPGFTFTSPAPDDHINIEQFRRKCWNQAEHIKKFEFVRIIGNENEAFAIVHVITNENKVIRNIEYFNFVNGKIKSIEVFFGGAGQGFPTNDTDSN
jgi:hypothetical protein